MQFAGDHAVKPGASPAAEEVTGAYHDRAQAAVLTRFKQALFGGKREGVPSTWSGIAAWFRKEARACLTLKL